LHLDFNCKLDKKHRGYRITRIGLSWRLGVDALSASDVGVIELHELGRELTARLVAEKIEVCSQQKIAGSWYKENFGFIE
jgi:hypothetical protein